MGGGKDTDYTYSAAEAPKWDSTPASPRGCGPSAVTISSGGVAEAIAFTKKNKGSGDGVYQGAGLGAGTTPFVVFRGWVAPGTTTAIMKHA
eukprot:9485270-Pyramimonas_sp.AAC.1